MNDLHISLSYRGQTCNFDLISGKQSEHNVIINGTNYDIVSDQKQISLDKEILNTLPLNSIQSESELEGRIKNLQNVTKVSVTPSVHNIGTNILGTASVTHLWKVKEEKSL